MSGTAAPRKGIKTKGLESAQQRRREAALARQAAARRDLRAYARSLAEGAAGRVVGPQMSLELYLEHRAEPEPETLYVEGARDTAFGAAEASVQEDAAMEEGADGEGVGAEGPVGRFTPGAAVTQTGRAFYAAQLATPEWMVDVPPDLRSNWYVLSHPEGERCLVITARGGTVSRRRNGSVLHRFPSLLPNGSSASRGSADQYCILDTVFHELSEKERETAGRAVGCNQADQTYYILDMMCWKGHSIYDSDFEFRAFWVQCKLAECDAGDPPGPQHRFRFQALPAYECSPEGLEAAYTHPVPYIRGGLLFYNKTGQYMLGLSPLVLHWKDAVCSRYFVDTDRDGNVLPQQGAVLQLAEGGGLVTGDDPPVVMATMPASFLEQHKATLRAGLLIKVIIGDRGIQIVDGKPVAADVQWDRLANPRRGGADSFTKVLFQYMARHEPLTIQHIGAAVLQQRQQAQLQALQAPPAGP